MKFGNRLARSRGFNIFDSRESDRPRWKFRSALKKVGLSERGECRRRKFLEEFLRREQDKRDESAKACVDRDPRDFTVHRSSYKALGTPGFFQRANEPKGSGAREKEKGTITLSQGNGALKVRRARTMASWEWFYFRVHDNCTVTVAVTR